MSYLLCQKLELLLWKTIYITYGKTSHIFKGRERRFTVSSLVVKGFSHGVECYYGDYQFGSHSSSSETDRAFLADLHGEDEAFLHVLRNASGNIKRKVNDLFGSTLREKEMKDLCTLIYYPEKKLELVKQTDNDLNDYYQTTLNQLITVCRTVSSKYTRSKVRKSLPEEYAYIIEELLHESADVYNKQAYFNVIVQTIIGTGRADHFIVALCYLIQRLSIDRLHILGDIFDRGPGAHRIMEHLCNYHHLDIEWGNHDVLWMGAAAGNLCSIAGVLRMSLRYANTQTLEEGYGINMVPLATFAMETYKDDPCDIFVPQILEGGRPD